MIEKRIVIVNMATTVLARLVLLLQLQKKLITHKLMAIALFTVWLRKILQRVDLLKLQSQK